MAVGDLSFAFDPSKGQTPQSIAAKRALAEAILGGASHAPKDVGEGLNAIGQAILYRRLMKGADTGEANGEAAASAQLAGLFPQQFPAAPGGSSSTPQASATPAAAPMDYPSQRVAQAFGDASPAPAPQSGGGGGGGIEAYVRQAAVARGIDPDIAATVARGEGGFKDPTQQSYVVKNGVRETSYGPFQLRIGGGLGDQALASGIDPRDPNQWQKGVDFALDQAKQGGWGPWYGAKAAGITGRMGIGQSQAAAPQQVAQAAPPQGGPDMSQYPVIAGGTSDAIAPGGPSLEVLAKAAANPWLAKSYGPVIGAMLQQKMAQSDPASQLDLKYKQAQLDALTSKDDTPESVRALNLRAEEAGLQKGTPEYRQFMLSGGSSGTNINVDTGTIPQGYQAVRDPQGRLLRYDPVPGGPADSAGTDAAKAENQATSGDVITGAADKIRTLSKNPLATGMSGALISNLPNSDAAEVYRQIDVLKSNATIENLNAMRAASKTGGALGNVTEGEGKMLAAKTGALDPKSPQFQQQLDDYERTLLRVVHGKDAGDQIFAQTRKPDASQPAAPAAARPRATNPKTGQSVEWDGTQWSPVQ